MMELFGVKWIGFMGGVDPSTVNQGTSKPSELPKKMGEAENGIDPSGTIKNTIYGWYSM